MYSVDEIIHLWEESKITTEEANRHLAEIGSRVRLDDTKESGWTEEEMKEGFIPGKPGEPVQRELDRSRPYGYGWQDRFPESKWQDLQGVVQRGWLFPEGCPCEEVR